MKTYQSVDFEQGSDEWLEWRTGGVTATDAVTLAGKNPYSGTPFTLWRVKTDRATPEDLDRNPNVRRGKEMEPRIRTAVEEEYTRETGDMLLPLCVQRLDKPHLRASLDGISSIGEPVEMKAPAEKTWLDVINNGTESPAFQMYSVQVQYQMLVTGSAKGYLIFGREVDGAIMLRRFTLMADKEMWRDLENLADNFYQQSIVKDIPPSKDPERDVYSPEAGESADKWVAVAKRVKRREDAIKELETKVKALKKQKDKDQEIIRALKGEFRIGEFAGIRLASFEVKGKVDYERIAREHVANLEDIEEQYRKPGRTQERLSVTGRDLEKNVTDVEQVQLLSDANERQATAYFSW